GREGGYYLWPEVALRELLSDEHYQVLSATWALGPAAFEHGHLLVEALPIGEVATLLELEPGRATELLAEAMAQLRVTQRKRSLPVDDKLLAGWNGLALAAFAEAARETGESGYTEV
ncbi:MAG TPA: thioredoxin domain-containing protein, partial [Gammaproteobacteria bacterium]|nr:thioredoxin domain-containing protein [Gammaproteobacteria bacterium]